MQEAHAERAKAQKEAQARRDAARDKAEAALKETGHLKDGFVLMPERSSGPESQEKDVNEAPEAMPEVEIQEEAAEPEPVESVEPEKTEEPEDTEEPDIVPFEWTSFKDRCLGRLVAQHRYNFKKVSGISQTFGRRVWILILILYDIVWCYGLTVCIDPNSLRAPMDSFFTVPVDD